MQTASPTNGLSVDLEDWFQVGPAENVIQRHNWEWLDDRIERHCDDVLALFAACDVQATFFALGWIVQRHPDLLRRIAAHGHELASYGWDHTRLFRMDRKEFAADLERSRKAIEDAAGVQVTGYRAPGFSIDHRTPWAYMALAEQGYVYSSSVLPVAHDHYGWREAPRFAFRPLPWSDLIEIPVTTVELGGQRIAAGGGGLFRALPYGASRWAIRQVNRREGRAAVFHFHPWEIDPKQQRVPNVLAKSGRRGVDHGAAADRLRQLITQFSWGRMDVLAMREAARASELAA